MPAPTPRRLQKQRESPRKRQARTTIPDAVEWAIRGRAGGRCELCGGALMERFHRHHRRLRSQGGRDEVVNLVLLHSNCHNTVHNNRVWAVENGWIVPSTRQPKSVPILLHNDRRVRLTTDGTYQEAAA